MKKKLVFGMLIVAGMLFATSCKKDDTPTTSSIEGFWAGKYSIGPGNPDHSYGFLFRSNGTVRVYENNADTTFATASEGTFTIVNEKVNTSYADNSVLTTATLNADATKMTNGTWGIAPSNSDGGKFYLDKK